MKPKRALSIAMVVVLLLASFTLASAQTVTRKDDTANPSYVGGQKIDGLQGRIKITMTNATSVQAVLHLASPVDFVNISTLAGTESYLGVRKVQLMLSPTGNASNFKKKYHNKDVTVTGILQANMASATYVPATECILIAPDGSRSVIVTMLKKPGSIKISGPSHELEQGKTMQLSAAIKPANALQLVNAWSSSNKKVATVDSNGVVTGVWKGTCYIYAKTANGKSAKWKVKVFISATGITLSETAITLAKGKTKTLKATVQPAGTGGGLTWGSSNTNVARVSAKGVVTAKGGGTATIFVMTNDRQHEAQCTVTVPGEGDPTALIVNVETNDLLLGVGATRKASARVYPSGTKVPTAISWHSSNDAIASVDSTGLITAKAIGMAVIEARSNVRQQGKTAPVSGATVVYVTANPSVTVASMSSADLRITYKNNAPIQLPMNRDQFVAALPGFIEGAGADGPVYYMTNPASGVNFAYWYASDASKSFKGFNTSAGDTSFKTNRGIAGGDTAEAMLSKYGSPGDDTKAVTISHTCDVAGNVTAVSYDAYATYFVGNMYLRFHLDLAAQRLDWFSIR